jgi:hypothetical protein
MRCNKFLLLVPLLICIFFYLQNLLLIIFTNPIKSHIGDGVFEDISRYLGPIPARGYTISMPYFSMNDSFNCEYQVFRLPNIGYKCGIFLAVDGFDSHTISYIKPEGFLELEILDSNCKTIAYANGELKSFIWCRYNKEVIALYQPGKTFFAPNSEINYRLRINYRPHSNLLGKRAFVYLRSEPD